jgi:hypothetical protein
MSDETDPAEAEAETHVTEITIQPDGRLYVFGTSRQVLELLSELRPGDASLERLLRHVREGELAVIDGGSSSAA